MLKLFSVLLILIHLSYSRIFPKSIKLDCHRSDPKLNNCLLNEIQKMLKSWQNGQLGADPIDPFYLEFTNVTADTESLKIKLNMKDIRVSRFSDGIFKSVNINPKTLKGEISFFMPNLRVNCEYSAKGQLLLIPLESHAYFDGNFTGINADVSFNLIISNRNNKKYYQIDQISLKYIVDSMNIKMTSVNPSGQNQLNSLQNFVKENNKLVLDTVYPIVTDNVAKVLKHIINGASRKYPIDVLLPE